VSRTTAAASAARYEQLVGAVLHAQQRRLGHTNLGIASIYLQGTDSTEIIDTVQRAGRRCVPSTQTLRL
jgi:hypothetical protein